MRLAFCALVLCGVLGAVGPAMAGASMLPMRLAPCAMVPAYSPAAHSFAAVRLALQDRRWQVTRQDQNAYQIVAEACTRPPGTVACASVTFGVDASGQVTVWLTDPLGTPANVMGHVNRWLRFFERSFNQYKCNTDEVLQALVLPLGIIVLPIPATATAAVQSPTQAAAPPQ